MSSQDTAHRDELPGVGIGADQMTGAGAAPRGEPGATGSELRAGTETHGEQLVREIVRYASDKKAGDLVTLDMRGVVGYTDWFVVCSGNTERQTKAIHDGILEGCKREHGVLPRRVEGLSRGDWILMDYLDLVVHVFTPATREYYRLEQLWGEAPVRAAGSAQSAEARAR